MKDKDLFIPLPLAQFSLEILASLKSFIKITPKVSLTPLLPTQSKFGGKPYWPHSLSEYPKDINGNPMRLVAQINFNDIYNSIESSSYPPYFPNTGLLQFFLPQTIYKDIDSLGNKSNDIITIYHETINNSNLMNEELNQFFNNLNFPIIKECELKFFNESHFCALTDLYHTKHFYHYFIDTICSKQEIHFYKEEEFNASGCKLDGYAHFNQQDPRKDNYNESNPWVLLLQIDSLQEDGKPIYNWHDFGTANWFIRKNDLINKDFSKILFHWD